MTFAPDWLPPLLMLQDHGHQWEAYASAVYAAFKTDFIDSAPTFRNMRIGLRRHPMYNNREWAFWHVIQEGNVEENRTPDFRRCERIRWIRAIIEHADDQSVLVWENNRGGNQGILLWLKSQDFLVVLGRRSQGYAMLVTAYPTNREHTRRKLLKEYDQAGKKSWPSRLS